MAQPKQKTLRPQVATTELGQSGTILIGGFLSQTDYNAGLTGFQALDSYDQMRKGDATVKAALLAVTLPIIGANWRMDPASDSAQDKDIADFVWDQLNGMTRSFEEFMREAFLFLPFGHYLFEIIYQLTPDGKIGLKKLAPRLPKTVQKWQTSTGDDGITQFLPNGHTADIPMEKLVVFVNEKEGDNWEGISLLRSAWKHWHMKDTLYKIDVIAAERQGLGVPYAKPTTSVTPEQKAEVIDVLKNLHAHEQGYLYQPMGWEIGFVDMGASGTRDPWKSIAHHDRQIVKSVLAEFLELGAGTSGSSHGGSHALSRSQSDLFMLSVRHYAKIFAATMNKYLIERLVDYNYTVDKYPTLMHDEVGDMDFDAITTSIQRLSQIGNWTPDVEVERVLRKAMSLPDLDEDVTDYPEPVAPAIDPLTGVATPANPAAKVVKETAKQPKKITASQDTFLRHFVASEAQALKEAVRDLHDAA